MYAVTSVTERAKLCLRRYNPDDYHEIGHHR